MATLLRDGSSDPARHEQAIEALAKETHAEVDHVRELYEVEHARLHATARVKTFVGVIATRLVRKVLHRENTSQ
jgi:hypothetical protein